MKKKILGIAALICVMGLTACSDRGTDSKDTSEPSSSISASSETEGSSTDASSEGQTDPTVSFDLQAALDKGESGGEYVGGNYSAEDGISKGYKNSDIRLTDTFTGTLFCKKMLEDGIKSSLKAYEEVLAGNDKTMFEVSTAHLQQEDNCFISFDEFGKYMDLVRAAGKPTSVRVLEMPEEKYRSDFAHISSSDGDITYIERLYLEFTTESGKKVYTESELVSEDGHNEKGKLVVKNIWEEGEDGVRAVSPFCFQIFDGEDFLYATDGRLEITVDGNKFDPSYYLSKDEGGRHRIVLGKKMTPYVFTVHYVNADKNIDKTYTFETSYSSFANGYYNSGVGSYNNPFKMDIAEK